MINSRCSYKANVLMRVNLGCKWQKKGDVCSLAQSTHLLDRVWANLIGVSKSDQIHKWEAGISTPPTAAVLTPRSLKEEVGVECVDDNSSSQSLCCSSKNDQYSMSVPALTVSTAWSWCFSKEAYSTHCYWIDTGYSARPVHSGRLWHTTGTFLLRWSFVHCISHLELQTGLWLPVYTRSRGMYIPGFEE